MSAIKLQSEQVSLQRGFVIKSASKILAELGRIAGAIAKSNAIPVLNGICIEVIQGKTMLTAADGTLFYRIISEAVESQESLSIVVPKMFMDVLKKLPEEEVICELKQERLILKSGKSIFEISVQNGEDFPRVKQPTEKSISLSGETLIKSLKGVAYATSEEEGRPILQGIHMMGKGNRAIFIATDSRRLGITHALLNEEVEEFANLVIPKRFALDILKNCDQENVELEIGQNRISIQLGNMIMGTRLIEGTYPDISRIFPKSFKREFTINREELLQAMDRASLLKEDGKKGTITRFNLQVDGIPSLVSKINNRAGKLKESIFITDVKGDEIEFASNAYYLMEALRSMDSKEVRFLMNESLEPFIIKPIGQEGIEALIMPVRVTN